MALPDLLERLGADGAALIDLQGQILAQQGETAGLAGEHIAAPDDHRLVCRTQAAWVVVLRAADAPAFDEADLERFDRLGAVIDLALRCCRLTEIEDEARRAVEAADAELQLVVYSVSHDLRNPLVSILGYLDVLAHDHAGELTGDGEHYLKRIWANAQHLQQQLQGLLELSRIGRADPPSQAVPLGEITRSVAEELRAVHPDGSVTVSGAFPVIQVSELRARQLLTHVLTNAVQHGGQQAHVNVHAREAEDGSVLLTVTDDGKGVPEHLREKAFNVFERLDSAASIPGTGMGLPICRRIVESLGGTIKLVTPPSGQPCGTTAQLALPKRVVLGWSTAVAP